MRLLPGCCLTFSLLLAPAFAAGAPPRFEGFTQPYREVELSFPEIGRIASLQVEEGDRVTAGQVLARLDTRLLEATLAIAEARTAETGALASAQALRDRRQLRLDSLLGLKVKGHAHVEEVAQARADLAVAEANLAAVREDLAIAALERDRVVRQIEQRVLRSPFDAIVTEVLKEIFEIVRPQDQPVLRLAEIDRLKVELHIPTHHAVSLAGGGQVRLDCPGTASGRPATVELVSPVTDPESGTVAVRLRIDHAGDAMRAGILCTTDLTTALSVSDRPE